MPCPRMELFGNPVGGLVTLPIKILDSRRSHEGCLHNLSLQ